MKQSGSNPHLNKWKVASLGNVLSLGLSASAFAVEGLPQLPQRHILKNAVQVRISDKGMKYYATNLGQILGNLQYQVNEGYFPPVDYVADKVINPDDYAETNPDAVRIYRQVRDLLNKWFIGFSLNDHRPRLEMGEFGYVADFSRFALVTDARLMQELGKTDGAILAIELDVSRLTATTALIQASDANNDFLGKLGVEDLTLTAASPENKMKMRLPFYIRVNQNGGIEFQAFELQNNIEELPLAFKYKKLLVPSFSVNINGKQFDLNSKELDNLVMAQAPTLLKEARKFLADFAKAQIPEMLNQKAQQLFAGGFEQIDDLEAPGKPENDSLPNLKWGLRLKNLNGQKEPFKIDLDAFIEDPMNVNSTPPAGDIGRGEPRFDIVPTNQYDIALSLDRAIFNRAIQLGFERRYFNEMKLEDGSTLKIVNIPTIDYVKTPAGVVVRPDETYIKGHVAIEAEPNSIFLKKKIVVKLDVIVKMRPMSDKSKMELVLFSVIEDSVKMDNKYIAWPGLAFKGKVQKEVRETVLKATVGWKTKDEILGSIPVPPVILGIKLGINRIFMDPGGHLVMFMDYLNSEVK